MADNASREPTMDEILADPTVRALMRADGVDPGRLRSKMLRLEAAIGGPVRRLGLPPVPSAQGGTAATPAACF